MNASSSSIGTVLLVAGVIFIAFTSMVLAQSEMDGAWWDYSYEGDPMPDGADPVWRCSSDEVSVASISDGILTIDTSTAPGGKLYYYMTLGSSGGKWDGSASSTIEFRARAVKVGPGGNDKAGLLNINTGTQSWTLSLALDKISMPDGAYPLDATEFHVYRITIDNSSGTPLYKVFVDGDLIYTSSEAKSSTTNRIIFGDSDSGAAGVNGLTQWDYIRWTNRGAFEPPERIALDAGKVIGNPNPFYGGEGVAIAYSLPESISQPESVWIRIYDETGRCVRTLKSISPVIWDGCDEKGAVLGSGIYLCVIGIKENGGFQPTTTGRLVNAGI